MGVAGMTILTVMGWSKTRELHLQWRGQPISYDLEPIPKIDRHIALGCPAHKCGLR